MTCRCQAITIRIAAMILGASGLVGCQMSAPIHVWKRPSVIEGGSMRLALAPIAGDPEIAQHLQMAMELSRPQNMPHLAVIPPDDLERLGGIQLVAYDGQPSEMGSLGAAKRAGADYLMTGQILAHRLEPEESHAAPPSPLAKIRKSNSSESLSVRWCVYEVASGRRLGEQTVNMELRQVDKQFPDLAFQSDGGAKVVAASARRSWELVVPTTHATEVLIDLPWLAPGSSAVRKGNAYARLGQWEMAERSWQDAADDHNWNTAAWKNLAIAAVAREDFVLARDRLKHADWKYFPGDGTRKTLSWIEQQQREYHAAFDLPTPREGWSLGDPPTASTIGALANSEHQANEPVSLDDQPWYTAMPFVPPPGWTWSQWWSQPWVW